MAASPNLNRNYHVFISFRGTDVRNNFLSHLYIALDEKGIHTFVDSEELRKGEQISATLVRAIEESCVAIIIFSEDYASSPWCLEEAVKIMECHEQKGLIVFPVFYKVEPREVRCGRESYGRAMAKHESKFGKYSEKVRRWKEALFDAGSLSGWNSNDSDEAELIGRIVKELSIHLDCTPLDVAKYPVGIDSRVQKLLSLSQRKSSANDVLMIGLWGPGGIGKTTIAKALYNALYNASIKRDDAIEIKFRGSSFLARVRETSNQSNGLVALQEQLLSQILFHKTVKVYNVDQGISLIRERLHCKKVLLVLDDVDQMDQLNALAGKGDWFGKGSRIIVTSRDKHLLTSHGINCVYEVKSLGYEKALDLFGRHAFPNGKGVEIGRDLIDRALHYANGLPLALEVLGSFLCGRNRPAWESALDKLSKSPDRTINGVLKSSFDGLEDNEQEIFLDIACFFRGKPIEYIKEVLDSCDFDATIGIEILIERSLIKEEFGTLQMHDLVELMGKHVVNQECPRDPWKRNRIWLLEDAMDILCETTETNAVNAIVLNMPVPEEMTISPDAFINMKKLRMLILHVHISSRGPVRLPNGLRYIDWPNSPNLEFGSGPMKIVSLNLHNSHIKQLGDGFQNFGKLKFINFSGCKFLARVPDLSSAPNIERLDLSCCKSLVEVHQSVAFLGKLKYLTIKFCSNLGEFPSTLQTKSLKWLNLCGFKFEKCPDIQVLENLEDLYLSGSAITELPASIGHLVSLRALHLKNCKHLKRLPSSIYKLKKLEHLDLQNCSNLVAFPRKLKDSIGLGFQNLEVLLLDGCNLSDVEFLESTSSFPFLQYLHLPSNEFTHPINKYDSWKGLFVYERNQLLKGVLKTTIGRAFLSGREMPEWILPGNGAFISFMVPPDLYDNFLGLAICFVPILEGGDKFQKQFSFQVSVNGGRLFEHIANLYKWESDGVWLGYVPRSFLHGVKELMPNEWSHFQVSIVSPYMVRVKKCGFRLVCEQHEDDLRVRTLTPSADAREIGNLKERDSGKRQLSIDSEEDWTKKMRLWSSRPQWR